MHAEDKMHVESKMLMELAADLLSSGHKTKNRQHVEVSAYHLERTSSVSFADHDEVKCVENLSRKRKEDFWFSWSEIVAFAFDTIELLARIESSDITLAEYAEMNMGDTSAFMGLEDYLTPTTSDRIARRRQAVLEAVLS
eukprot:CAMPEP_0172563282 /NCGR_PEP_ID=MMETSP1067-20121228/100211_1 /TAXON_ID=265564 ORGANISM="Thalassiosira punctigera, Strain Tpunct2005C2" /NCGR_SAMPLE_ID=MMETSP1067 /ASSEMBLY_ACC=CAM_ASM_000444 /LENGTH=139 /DNA_ID=CAMNT_0013353697 /DNA_START=68 /DNA_END=483 /DNA_ORIENTATION=+